MARRLALSGLRRMEKSLPGSSHRAPVVGLNRRVRLIINRAYGSHSANAALGLIMVTLGLSNASSPMNARPPQIPEIIHGRPG
jgi:hypothetical protein